MKRWTAGFLAILTLSGCGGGRNGGGDGGETISTPGEPAPSSKWGLWSELAASGRFPAIVRGENGIVLYGWVEDPDPNSPAGSPDKLLVKRFAPTDGWSNPVVVATDLANNCQPSLRWNPVSKRPVIAYRQNGESVGLITLGISDTDAWSSVQYKTSVAVGSSGYLSWQLPLFLNTAGDKATVFYRREDALGTVTFDLTNPNSLQVVTPVESSGARSGVAHDVDDVLSIAYLRNNTVLWYNGTSSSPLSLSADNIKGLRLFGTSANRFLAWFTNTTIGLARIDGPSSVSNLWTYATNGPNVIHDLQSSSPPGSPEAMLVWLESEFGVEQNGMNYPVASTVRFQRLDLAGAPLEAGDIASPSSAGIPKLRLRSYGQGGHLAVWSESMADQHPNGSHAVRSARYLPGTGWNTVATIAETGQKDAAQIALSVAESGSAIAVWDQRTSASRVLYDNTNPPHQATWDEKRTVFMAEWP